ncbi:MAG: M20 family metallopeptidase [Bacteroidales bacterium]|jgi:amidohydrolase|nr:M20 family metallopeptidase [Bacteroidales bacterium]
MELKNNIDRLVEKYFDVVVNIRRHIHENPELSFHEYETSKYITSLLDSWNIKYKTGIASTGISCIIEGRNPNKKIIALRADIDALPVTEENNTQYKSKNIGVMHACGHDAHTASLLGTLLILNELKDQFEGTIKFIFQPAEEKLPGGAKQMIEEGILENPAPEFILGQHVYPELTYGKVGFKKGVYMASSDELYLTIKGKGGHAALPEKITNTVLIASQIILALQQVKELSPNNIPTILSIGKVIANGATNVIPNEVNLEGTFRTMDENWRKIAHKKITDIAKSIAEKQGATIDINIKKGYPVLINNKNSTEKIIQYSKEYLGNENVVDLDIRMTAEDFAYYSQKIPATFYRFGTSLDSENIKPLHSSNFDINEESLKTGMGTMAYISIKYLNN